MLQSPVVSNNKMQNNANNRLLNVARSHLRQKKNEPRKLSESLRLRRERLKRKQIASRRNYTKKEKEKERNRLAPEKKNKAIANGTAKSTTDKIAPLSL